MKTLVLFYSYTGNTRALAQRLAKAQNADLEEVQTLKRPGTVAAYVLGSFAAMRHKPAAIQPIKAELAAYDRIELLFPIWASNPAPAFYSVLAALPAGKTVGLHMVSGSGASNQERISALVQERFCTVAEYKDYTSSAAQEG